MYNLLEYSGNYSLTLGSLQNYYRYETNNDANENNAARNKINNKKTITSKSFEETEFVVPLKYLSNFWRSLFAND